MMGATHHKVVVGVDAGASHTEALVATRDLRALGRARGDPGNLRPGAVEAAAAAVVATARAALGQAEQDVQIRALVVGAAGAGATARTAELGDILAREFHCPTRVVTDGEIALEAAFGRGPGIVLVAGSGTIAFARAADDSVHRAGGWGWRVGDEGGAYWIACRGVAAVARAHDGRGPATELTRALVAHARVADPVELLEWAHRSDVATLADLARIVIAEAARGDAAATDVLREAAGHLADHVAALARFFTASVPPEVILAGGVLRTGSPLRAALHSQVARRVPAARIADRDVDPPAGAVAIAWRTADGED